MFFAADQRGAFMACHSGTHHEKRFAAECRGGVFAPIKDALVAVRSTLADTSIRPGDGAFLEHGDLDGFAVCAANGHYRQASVYGGKQVGSEECLGETCHRKTLPPDRFPVPGTQPWFRQESVRSRRYANKPSAPGPVAGCRR